MSNKGWFLIDAKAFNCFHLENETKERNLTTGVLTIEGLYCGKEVLVKIKNGIAMVTVDNGILLRLNSTLLMSC